MGGRRGGGAAIFEASFFFQDTLARLFSSGFRKEIKRFYAVRFAVHLAYSSNLNRLYAYNVVGMLGTYPTSVSVFRF